MALQKLVSYFDPTCRPLIKNLFYKIFLNINKESKIDFQNRKWNYPNRKWNYFSHFQASDQKTTFTTSSPYLPRSSKVIFKTGNRIIQISQLILTQFDQTFTTITTTITTTLIGLTLLKLT